MIFQIHRVLCGLLTAGLLFQACTDTSSTSYDRTLNEELTSALRNTLNASQAHGVSAAVVFPDKTVWTDVSGYSHENVQIRRDMLFDMGDVSRNIMAAMVLRLVDSGALELDAPIADYIVLPANVNPEITVRQCLDHTSGLFMTAEHPLSPFQSEFSQINHSQYWSLNDIFTYLMDAPYFEPGSGWHYTLAGYQLCKILIETQTGLALHNAIEQELTDPLGLGGILLDLSEPLPSSCSIAHNWLDSDSDGCLEDISCSSRNWLTSMTGGQFYSTAEDLTLWMHSLMNGSVVSGAALREMTDFHFSVNEDSIDGYGLGTLLKYWDGDEIWGHYGSAPGYRTIAAYVPEYDIALTVMINNDSDAALEQIFDTLWNVVKTEIGLPSADITTGYYPQ